MVPAVLAPGPAAPGLSPVLLPPGCPVRLVLVALQRQRPYAVADLTPLQDDRHWPLCCGKGAYCLSAPGLRSASGPRGLVTCLVTLVKSQEGEVAPCLPRLQPVWTQASGSL